MSELKQVLMERDDLSSSEADASISEMQERILSGDDAEEVLMEIGLEMDYFLDLI